MINFAPSWDFRSVLAGAAAWSCAGSTARVDAEQAGLAVAELVAADQCTGYGSTVRREPLFR
ncbi:hypothetical protein GCM10009533_12580 [Saccharopolyspora spinosporotrichia]|uniref:Uncharacterized protein n=1 Tax=Saccharopolyspora erythraea TaxID=1836 RepID=A0ABP3MBF0_SACER|nr:hypothetical protein N599_33075 [Saccharopolyspora erythraea D]